MNTRYRLLSIIFLSLFSLALQASPVSSITDISEQWRASFNAGTKGALIDLYSAEAVLFQPDNSIAEDTASISDYLNKLNYLNIEEFIIWDVEIDATNDVAYETALWEVSGIDENGNAVSYDVNVTNVLERQNDGSWKIRMQSFN